MATVVYDGQASAVEFGSGDVMSCSGLGLRESMLARAREGGVIAGEPRRSLCEKTIRQSKKDDIIHRDLRDQRDRRERYLIAGSEA